ncbi:MAG: DUF5056 domain-containing protein [Paludibacter sp.]
METNNNDKLLKDFFGEIKHEVPDDGFSQRLMRKLPEQPDRSWIVWVFTFIGMILTLFFGLYTGSIQAFVMLLQHIQVFYFLIGIFCFPLIGSLSMYFMQNKGHRLI